MLAIFAEYEETVETLLNANADPKMLAMNGRQLLSCFIVIDSASLQTIGWSPLHFAANMANMHITKLLLQKGADTELKDKVTWPLYLYGLPITTGSVFQNGQSAVDVCAR